VTLRNLRQGKALNEFGSIIFTRKDRDDINTIADLKGKTISAVSITGLGACQMQWRQMIEKGMEFLLDPKMVIFTKNQRKSVADVVAGIADVGFVRTDMAESMHNTTFSLGLHEGLGGTPVSMDDIKVIEPLNPAVYNSRAAGAKAGTPSSTELGGFPFPTSTILYPEWSIGALDHVPSPINKAVADALLALEGTWRTDEGWTEAQKVAFINQNPGCSVTTSTLDATTGLPGSPPAPPAGFVPGPTNYSSGGIDYRCYYALNAITKGGYVTWDPPVSYMSLREMQEGLNWINIKTGACIRSSQMYDAIVCPSGYFRKSRDEVDNGCENEGIECPADDDYTCVCQPCRKVPDQEFSVSLATASGDSGSRTLCSKMERCGEFTQGTRGISLVVKDEWREARGELNLSSPATAQLRVSVGKDTQCLVPPGKVVSCTTYSEEKSEVNDEGEFVFNLESSDSTGIVIAQVLVDGEEIPLSPPLLVINSRPLLSTAGIIGVSLGCLAFVLLAIAFLIWLIQWTKDKHWKIPPGEVAIDEPPVVLGEGTFGLVLMGKYRGTNVAIKRILPQEAFTAGFGGSITAPGGRRSSAVAKSAVHAASTTVQPGTKVSFEGPKGADTFSSSSKKAAPLNGNGNGHAGDDTADVEAGGPASVEEEPSMEEVRGGGGAHSTWAGKSILGRLSVYHNPKPAEIRRRALRDFKREVRLVSTVRHPNIITVMGASKDDRGDPLLVMEHMHRGSLSDMLINPSVVIEAEHLLELIRDIAKGMSFLHASGILHNDLKTQNVLVDSHMRAKVSDFGFSTKSKATKFVGTPYYMAPEVLIGEPQDKRADVYSFGITAWEIVVRRVPYHGLEAKEVLRSVADLNRDEPFRPAMPDNMPEEVASLIRECWAPLREDRPSFAEVVERLAVLPSQVLQPVVATRQVLRDERDEGGQNLPTELARAMKSPGLNYEMPYKLVTLVFTDVVGYTAISAALGDSSKVSGLLQRLFDKFDNAAERLGMVTVDVIGDAYMAVVGLHGEDHMRQSQMAAQFAEAVMVASQETEVDPENPDLGMVRIRAGIAMGPATAAVVGVRTRKFSLFGDTVNTAARMETTSKPRCIQMSEATAVSLRQSDADGSLGFKNRLKYRGKIQVKGKGMMETYWLTYEGGPDPVGVRAEGHPGQAGAPVDPVITQIGSVAQRSIARGPSTARATESQRSREAKDLRAEEPTVIKVASGVTRDGP